MHTGLNLQPTLENDLVAIRLLEQKDFEYLYAVASDPLIWEQHQDRNRYTTERFTSFFRESLESNGAPLIMENKKVIGSARFKVIDQR